MRFRAVKSLSLSMCSTPMLKAAGYVCNMDYFIHVPCVSCFTLLPCSTGHFQRGFRNRSTHYDEDNSGACYQLYQLHLVLSDWSDQKWVWQAEQLSKGLSAQLHATEGLLFLSLHLHARIYKRVAKYLLTLSSITKGGQYLSVSMDYSTRVASVAPFSVSSSHHFFCIAGSIICSNTWKQTRFHPRLFQF